MAEVPCERQDRLTAELAAVSAERDAARTEVEVLKAEIEKYRRHHVLAGLRGGRARAAKLTPERRSEIARLGGVARARKAAESTAEADTLESKALGQ